MLTIESMYELAHRAARNVPYHPACDYDDLVQCAVVGMVEAAVPTESLATVVARRRVIDEVRRTWGRTRRTDPMSAERSPRAASYLFQPFGHEHDQLLADLIEEQDDPLARVDDQIDASREAAMLLRAVGRRGKHALVWHVVQERSIGEIADRFGVTSSRVSQIVAEARQRARRAHAARGQRVHLPRPAPESHPRDPQRLDATVSEKRAFGEFRKLQRAGLNRQEALAAMPDAQRELVAEYQRKCQRRARARAAGLPVAKQPPRTQRRIEHVDEVMITPEERLAAGAVWTLRSRGASWSGALTALPRDQRVLAESYNAKMRARARVRSHGAAGSLASRASA